MKTCAADQLKQELMERYGLKADQIKIELNITLPRGEEEKALNILKDFDKYHTTKDEDYLHDQDTIKAGNVFGEKIHYVFVQVPKVKEGVH